MASGCHEWSKNLLSWLPSLISDSEKLSEQMTSSASECAWTSVPCFCSHTVNPNRWPLSLFVIKIKLTCCTNRKQKVFPFHVPHYRPMYNQRCFHQLSLVQLCLVRNRYNIVLVKVSMEFDSAAHLRLSIKAALKYKFHLHCTLKHSASGPYKDEISSPSRTGYGL